MMKSILLALLALSLVSITLVSAQSGVPDANGNVMLPPEPLWKLKHQRAAIMTPPSANLTKPIIYSWRLNETNHKHHSGHRGVIRGAPPATLKKVKVTRNLYGGHVEWEKGTHPRTGCACKRQVKKFRYDAEFYPKKNKKSKRRFGYFKKGKCHCGKRKKAKLPPVVAELYPKKVNHTKAWLKKHHRHWHGNATHPGVCKKKHKKKMVAPEYKPEKKSRRHRRRNGKKGKFHGHEWHRLKNGTVVCKKHKKKSVVPEFYPHRKSNSTHLRSNGDSNKAARAAHRVNRKHRKQAKARTEEEKAAAKARREARRAKRKAKRAAKKARRHATKTNKQTPGPDTPVVPFKGNDPVSA